ncbi:3-oxoacyl-ACP reductase [Rhodococcoides fascians]|uniref:SDR family NAD(P)-dependent oxidoreductase n=1 Tax=Rhodococcoides fascians TaxID=1828 RepID=UPI000B9A5066|nr:MULTISPECIES: SDR family NAD(P)-dependent oxidoreductase [Rhodococcus]OZD72186.1 3-oxoacyl-ACP reductase [Rhodococcus sp. 06-1059B-a]OZE81335.1 3-oxoacyl-ACP reductase [Rhodococcus fascians]OZF08914.1 3-oxoacyl-ACP reductase [Rhodococcus fascians]OZF12355.1 3-oxoacyl-ACP reductase [Rhodococcus fascians]OZF59343.1 3-oxoacyl-ACP reductase [Rhodococcus fascians]
MTRLALVTGGGSGLGAAAAQRLRADGIDVITVDMAGDIDIQLDVTDEDAVSAAQERIGPVDILINSAGILGPTKKLTETSTAEWRRVYEVNVFGTVNMMRTFVPAMIKGGYGRVINLVSIAGKEGNAGQSVYSSSKAAVIALTKSSGKELATTGVLVNAVAPAAISTPMVDGADPATAAHYASLIPMGRLGRADEVAELIAFLASDRVSFSTGSVYDISGGRATY